MTERDRVIVNGVCFVNGSAMLPTLIPHLATNGIYLTVVANNVHVPAPTSNAAKKEARRKSPEEWRRKHR
jgi:hypothetical protein